MNKKILQSGLKRNENLKYYPFLKNLVCANGTMKAFLCSKLLCRHTSWHFHNILKEARING
jgi:hypothetical protein